MIRVNAKNWTWLLDLLIAVFSLSFVTANTAGSHVMLLTIDEAIGPSTDDYIGRALEAAADERAELVISLGTPRRSAIESAFERPGSPMVSL